MKHTLILLIALFMVAFTGCKKEEKTPAPIACIQPSTAIAKAGVPVTFTSCSANADSYQWDFGDSATATTATADHAFNSPGKYTVKLTVTNQTGSSDTSYVITISRSATEDFIGTYYVDDQCNSGDYQYEITITPTGAGHRVSVNNLSQTANAFATIEADTIIIESQPFGGGTISGKGIITATLKRINMNYTYGGRTCLSGWSKQ